MGLILPRRRLIGAALAAPAVLRANAQPVPGLLMGNSAPSGVLDQLSGTTTVVAAWSSCRSLKASTYFSGAMKVRSNEAGTQTTIGFAGGALNTAALLAVCVGGNKEGVIQLLDQSGNANHVAPRSGVADPVICSTAGAFTQAISTTAGSMPMFGLGAGNQAGVSGSTPSMQTAIPMPVSFGASAKHFCLCVIRPTSGSGDIHGQLANFVHTGDANSFSTATSITHLQCNGSNTSGVYDGFGNGLIRAVNTITPSANHLLGSVFDSANHTVYADLTGGTPVACTLTLGSGGAYGMGDEAITALPDQPWCGFVAEMITGTFSNSAASFVAGDWTVLQNNLRAFYGTP